MSETYTSEIYLLFMEKSYIRSFMQIIRSGFEQGLAKVAVMSPLLKISWGRFKYIYSLYLF